MTGATLRVAWLHFLVTMLMTDGSGREAGQAHYFRQMDGEIAKRIGTSSAVNFPFLKGVSQNCFVFDAATSKIGKSRRIASLLMLSTLKIEEVSQNCFVFEVVKFKNEEVLQDSFVLKLAGSQMDRLTDRKTDR